MKIKNGDIVYLNNCLDNPLLVIGIEDNQILVYDSKSNDNKYFEFKHIRKLLK